MAVVRRTLPSGTVRWRAKVFVAHKEVASKSFATRRDALAWHDDTASKLRTGEWVNPRRGDATFQAVSQEWLASRAGKAARTQDTDAYALTRRILPELGRRSVASITEADISTWLGGLATAGVATSTQARSLAVVRGVLGHAVADRRLRTNVAAAVKPPKGGRRREGRPLTVDELYELANAVPGYCTPVILALGLCGMRFSEMAALTVGDVLSSPRGLGLRIHQAAPQKSGSGAAVLGDTKSHRSRFVPLPRGDLYDYVARRVTTGDADEWLFRTRRGLIWTNTNFCARSNFRDAVVRLGLGDRRIHDLRHTSASSLLLHGADLKAVQGILGHASATMTADLYGHLMDGAAWRAMEALDQRPPAGSAGQTLATDLPG